MKFNYYTQIEQLFEDDCYMETTIVVDSPLSPSTSKSGSKTNSYKGTNGQILWSIKVSGTFTYTGSSSVCSSSSLSITCPGSTWKLSNQKASKSGATATGSVTAKEYTLLGICAQTINKTVRLTCDSSGRLS